MKKNVLDDVYFDYAELFQKKKEKQTQRGVEDMSSNPLFLFFGIAKSIECMQLYNKTTKVTKVGIK